jgi:hypothetical protein
MNPSTQKSYEIADEIVPTLPLFSKCYHAPFDKGMELLQSEGYHIPSLDELAKLRMQEGRESNVSKNGDSVREGVVYLSKDDNRLVRKSPLLDFVQNIFRADRESRKIYIPIEKAIEKALVDSITFPATNTEIPTNRFGENELTVWAFGDSKKARAYGDFLKDAGIDKMPIRAINQYNNNRKLPFVNQLWLYGLEGIPHFKENRWVVGFGDGMSCFDGNRSIIVSGKVRGVLQSIIL